MSTIPTATTDIRNIRPNGKAPDKIYRIIDGEAVEIKKAYRCINGEAVVVWDVKDTPPTPVITGFKTVWAVNNLSHTLHINPLTGVSIDGMIDWGDGTVEEYQSGYGISHNYAENGDYTVTIDCDIVEVANYAFKEADTSNKRDYTLLECYLPDTAKIIGDYCFQYCLNLRKLVLPDNLTTIGAAAFHYTSALDTVEIPESVTKIGNACFWVSGITHIVIPEGITTITSMFDHCYNLVDVTLPQSLTNIGSYTFNYCTSLKNIDIPKNVNTIVYDAFANTFDITIRIHRSAPPPTGSPWRAVRANVQWVG